MRGSQPKDILEACIIRLHAQDMTFEASVVLSDSDLCRFERVKLTMTLGNKKFEDHALV